MPDDPLLHRTEEMLDADRHLAAVEALRQRRPDIGDVLIAWQHRWIRAREAAIAEARRFLYPKSFPNG